MSRFEFGYISRAHGLDGELIVRTYDPASEVFEQVGVFEAVARDGKTYKLTVEEVAAASKGDLRVAVKEVRQRVKAEALVGAKLFVDREALDPCEEGEFFHGDLVGLAAFDEQGVALGQVDAVWNTGPVPNLVIHNAAGEELLVPFAEQFVVTVDLAGRRVVVRPLELAIK